MPWPAASVRRAGVLSATGVTTAGEVRVTLTRGDARKQRTVDLRGGRFSVGFGPTNRPGKWAVRVEMLRHRNFQGSADATSFRVGG